MNPIHQIKELIGLAEQAFSMVGELDSIAFENASCTYFDAIACSIHKIVKEHGLQEEYYKLSENSIFESVADEWLAKNPFNPETNPTVKCC